MSAYFRRLSRISSAILFLISLFTMVFIICLSSPVLAQSPGNPYAPDTLEGSGAKRAAPSDVAPGAESPRSLFPYAVQETRSQDVEATSIPLGQPGLSFRYVQTFGETETGYIEDTNHFYGIGGLGADGSNIWMTDSWGNRALKFDGNGNFIQKIGKAGFRNAIANTVLDYPTDVAIDGSGNIWIVDGSAAHVIKFDSNGQRLSELGQSWNFGSGNNQFSNPIGIVFGSTGHIYVSDGGLWDDSGNHRIQIFDADSNYVATLGETGVAGSDNAHFRQPRRMAIYGAKLYIADAGNHRVQIFDITNPVAPVYEATLGTAGVSGSGVNNFNFPEGLGVTVDRIYVADSNNNRVQVFDRTSLAYVATIGTGSYGTGPYEFNHPSDVVFDLAGNVYIADEWNKRVQQYTSAHVYVRTYGTTGVSYLTDGYHYNQPAGLAIAQDNSTYIVESRGHRLVKLSSSGTFEWSVGEAGQNGSDNAHLFFPQDVEVDRQGRVFVADYLNHRVQVFSSNGQYVGTLGAGWGSQNDQFDQPVGIGIAPNAYIYIADCNNHRVQVFDPDLNYLSTLGVSGEAGSDNAHFNCPYDVAVDSNGVVYVADEVNDRVQVFDANYTYVRTIGQTGTSGDAFDRLSDWGPHRVAVDAQNRLYVTDAGNNRVQVFDANGAYLTTVGGAWGQRNGQMRAPHGVAIAPNGDLYVAELDNHRVQRYVAGVPSWNQTNLNGFGERQTTGVLSLAPFNGSLYAGTYTRTGNGAQLWRSADGYDWAPVTTNGFGDPMNGGIYYLIGFNSQLYASTGNRNGGQIWRSSNGQNWSQVVEQGFGTPTNGEIFSMASFKNHLYASTWTYTNTHGAEIWRSSTGNSGDWQQVINNGFDDPTNRGALTMEVFEDHLYVGTHSTGAGTTGCQIWRSDGTTWLKVVNNGFGNKGCYAVQSLAAYNGYLYAGTGLWDPTTQSYPGGEIWRCSAASGCEAPEDWVRVVERGFQDPHNAAVTGLIVFDTKLYALTYNFETGMEVWRTDDGVHWEMVSAGGFGDSNNVPFYDNGATVFDNRLFVGTVNNANGGEIWQFLHNWLYLPTMMR